MQDRPVWVCPACLRVILAIALCAWTHAAGQNEESDAKTVTQADAAGGCDGIKNGKWGFHTSLTDDPWWQVDLGESQPIARVAIWNRCDTVADRSSRLIIKLSETGEQWRTAYVHDGTAFLGYADGKPLVVQLEGQAARLVRIQVPGHTYLHLDEVEVFGLADPQKNVALRRPADQIDISDWSTNLTTGIDYANSVYEKKSTPVETYLASAEAYLEQRPRYEPLYVLGPFDETDQTLGLGSELNLDAAYTGQGGRELRWSLHSDHVADAMEWRRLDNLPAFKGTYPAVGYLAQRIYAPTALSQQVSMFFGVPSPVPWQPLVLEAWLNGQPLKARNHSGLRLDLKKGYNHLVMRVRYSGKGWLTFTSIPPDTTDDKVMEQIRARVHEDFPNQPVDLVDEFCLLQEDIWRHNNDSETRRREAFLASQVLSKQVLILDDDRDPLDVILRRVAALLEAVAARAKAPDLSAEADRLADLREDSRKTPLKDVAGRWRLFLRTAALRRSIALADPLLDFDAILFTKRAPGSFNHMCDQYYGWFSRPGGGIYILRDFKTDSPAVECITQSFAEPGSFLRPALSYDASKLLFAWCKHYPNLAGEPDKLNKDNVPADAFYHVFEMNIDGTGVRQLTFGKYDDFDARYLPDGRIVFLSTRRGQFIQCGPHTARQTLAADALPDSYVRCGGDARRPVAVYTLHTMSADGSNLCAISPFENFEWTPSIADDGTILHSRWDYVDRYNNAFMSLWAIRPDGTYPRLVYGNHTWSPHTTFEARSIPNSDKLIFTASAHHGQTMGSLVLLDPTLGTEGDAPITRLTPEIPFPEIEGFARSYYANPWPLSEELYLAAWGYETGMREWWKLRVPNGFGLCLLHTTGNRIPLFRDPELCCMSPIPVRPRKRPPSLPTLTNWDKSAEGRFLLADVYQGLRSAKPGDVKALRIVAVPPKTHPVMNSPMLGHTGEDPGKCVLGTVPVEADGSAYFRAPAGVSVFFQALDHQGRAIQTMRTLTHVQAGETLSCIGCHEPRMQAPPTRRILATAREPSRIRVGPTGSWPLRFDALVQPVLDRHCVQCHNPKGEHERAARLDLTADKAYQSLSRYGRPSLIDLISEPYNLGYSTDGKGVASQSQLLARIEDAKIHEDLKLEDDSLERLILWMDLYVQQIGSYSAEQERLLMDFREQSKDFLIE